MDEDRANASYCRHSHSSASCCSAAQTAALLHTLELKKRRRWPAGLQENTLWVQMELPGAPTCWVWGAQHTKYPHHGGGRQQRNQTHPYCLAPDWMMNGGGPIRTRRCFTVYRRPAGLPTRSWALSGCGRRVQMDDCSLLLAKTCERSFQAKLWRFIINVRFSQLT